MSRYSALIDVAGGRLGPSERRTTQIDMRAHPSCRGQLSRFQASSMTGLAYFYGKMSRQGSAWFWTSRLFLTWDMLQSCLWAQVQTGQIELWIRQAGLWWSQRQAGVSSSPSFEDILWTILACHMYSVYHREWRLLHSWLCNNMLTFYLSISCKRSWDLQCYEML